MLRRVLAGLAAVLLVVAGPAVAAATVPPTDPPAAVDNEFIPADRDLSECVSALPQPGCGSTARGGWRQTLVLGLVVAALALIGWRIIRTVRRNRQIVEASNGR